MDGGDVNPFLLTDLLTANKDATLATEISKIVATCYEILPGNLKTTTGALKLFLDLKEIPDFPYGKVACNGKAAALVQCVQFALIAVRKPCFYLHNWQYQ